MGMNNDFDHFLDAGCWVPNNILLLAKMNDRLSRKQYILYTIAMIEFDSILNHDILMNQGIVSVV
jgi:hypothetical protein